MTDGTLITLISLLSVVLFVVGVPIFLTIGVWLVGVSWVIGFTLSNIGAAFTDTFTTTFALLALPLFVLTGDLINAAGIAKRLANFAYACLGWLRGGLAMATLGACGLFAAISGSNSATTATIGSIMHPELVKNGYDTRFAAATTAAGGTVGIIIPPSIIFIVYGFIMNVPIAELFIAGVVPGAMMVLAMMAVAFVYSLRNGWGKLLALSIRRFLLTAVGAWMGFAAIGLVLYGIYEGAFSPTEAASVTASVALIVALICYPIARVVGRSRFEIAFDEGRASDPETRPGMAGFFGTLARMLVVRGFRLRDVPDIVLRSAQITGILAPLIAVSIVMQQVLSLLGANAALTEFMQTFGTYYAVLFVAMFIVLLAGTVLESLPNTIILAPILAPIAVSYGVDPIHFGVVFLIGDAIGFITPPYGLNLYVASGVTGIPYFRLLAYTLPYLISLLLVWIAVALVPELSLFLVTGLAS